MKRTIAILVLSTFLFSCKKDDVKHCYECDLNTGHYEDVGCYTTEDWNNRNEADRLGNTIDKSRQCRKK